MASALLDEKDSMECGYCLGKGQHLVDPRLFPCNHVHCYPCLVGNFNTNRIIRCGKCKEVFDVTLSRLPPSVERGGNSQVCDVCSEKGTTDQLAVSYCTSCNRKMCVKHSELHQDFQPLHKDVLSIEEYKQCYGKLELRNCNRHEQNPITMGCSNCCQVLCTSCMDGTNQCVDIAHQAVVLEELVKLLKVKKDKVKIAAQAKEEKLSELLKSSTRIFVEFERKTEELLELLHKTRDEQLAELQKKYNKLEKELMKERRRSKEQLVEFMEKDIGVRMTDINTLLLLQDAKFRDSHPVDILSSFLEATRELEGFIDESLPSTTLVNQRKLSTQGKMRRIEVSWVEDVSILVKYVSPPTNFTHKTTVQLDCNINAVCHHNGFTYVGARTAVNKIDGLGNTVTSLGQFRLLDMVIDMCIYKEKVYILVSSRIDVYDIEGHHITSWGYSSTYNFSNKLVVTGDKVIILDSCEKQLGVYTLDGQFVKFIKCQQDWNWLSLALCAPDQESVVVSSSSTSTVLRVHLETGKVIWTFTDITKPGGIACYKQEHILVASLGEIHVLEAKSGKHLGKLGHRLNVSNVFHLDIADDTLLVALSDKKLAFFYELSA